MGDFFWIIIVIAVIASIISAAAKKKAREQARRDAQGQEAQQGPRSAPMSDIQRAFMLAQETASPKAAVQRPAYAPQQSATHTPLQSRASAPMEARTSAVMQPHPMYAMPPSANGLPTNFYNGSMGAANSEGWSDNTDDDKPMELLRTSEVESVADIDLETKVDSGVSARPQQTAASEALQSPLKLFEDKNEFIKAVIYSEVLTRRKPGKRAFRA